MLFGKKKSNGFEGQTVSGDEPKNPFGPKFKKGGKVLKRGGIVILLLLIAIFISSNAAFSVGEQEKAVVVTFGVPKAITTPGLHFKIPLIQQVHKVNTTINGFAIGYDEVTDETTEDGIMITSDYNFVNVDFYCEYRVSDPVDYLYCSQEPEEILKNIAQSCIRTVISSYNVDSVLTTGKNEIQGNIKDLVLKRLEEDGIGLQLVNIRIQDAQPPTSEVMQAFKAVETAKQGKETALNNANKYRNEKLPEAKAQADQIVQDAEAKKQQRINEAQAQVARFEAMYEEYKKNPTITKQRMFYESMEEVLPGLKLVIDDGSGIQKLLPLEGFYQDMTEESSAVTAQ